ncbi:MAG: threonine-phosphate decarboxylase CobD [Peptococcaceae bacterium]|jgi:threonine-phosphate decarboxylase|nr:threonine-phosphate decarboxylase CobD [Peptococcaceae bacterium]
MIFAHGGNLRAAQLRYGIPAGRFVDFSANINPYGPSDAVVQALAENLREVRHYPDPDSVLLRQSVAAHLGVSADWVMAGNGASELIYLLARVFAWRRALIIGPTFSEYAAAVTAAGGRVREVPTSAADGFVPSLAAVAEALPCCDAVFWCQPNNPTGRLLEPDALARLAALAGREGASLVVDEAFLDFVPGRDAYSALPLLPRHPGLLVLYSLTKILAVPGLRLGALIASPSVLRRLQASRDPWSVNTMAQVAGVAGLRERDFLAGCAARVARDREELQKRLSALPGVRVLPGRANFLLVAVGESGYSSAELVDALGRQGVLVRDCGNFPGLETGYIRVAVRTREDNARLAAALAGVLAAG